MRTLSDLSLLSHSITLKSNVSPLLHTLLCVIIQVICVKIMTEQCLQICSDYLHLHFSYKKVRILPNISQINTFTRLKYTIEWFLVYSQTCASIIRVNFKTFLLPQKKTL